MLRLLIAIAGITSSACFAHELPDNTLVRNIQITCQADTVLVSYEIGMNPNTLAELYEAAEEAPPLEQDPAKQAQQFIDELHAALAKNLELRIGEEAVELELQSSEPAPKHHLTARFVFQAAIDQWPDQAKLSLADTNWLDLDGTAKVAVRGKRVRVSEANAALLIVRASPIELGPLKLEERAEMLTIRATVKP